jgi:hypothetical protein
LSSQCASAKKACFPGQFWELVVWRFQNAFAAGGALAVFAAKAWAKFVGWFASE